MTLQEFCDKRPYLYHLTDRTNLPIILKTKSLFSTKDIANFALPKKDVKGFLRGKRDNHVTLTANGIEYKIRDQKPILLTVLNRSLSGGDAGDFIELLNTRVFWWPTLTRLIRHYNRYESESPIILRVNSADILELNKNVEFCHLNSGATRCHPKYGGNAPTRGKDSFLGPEFYNKGITSIAEVTFVDGCYLPEIIWIGDAPDGNWKLV